MVTQISKRSPPQRLQTLRVLDLKDAPYLSADLSKLTESIARRGGLLASHYQAGPGPGAMAPPPPRTGMRRSATAGAAIGASPAAGPSSAPGARRKTSAEQPLLQPGACHSTAGPSHKEASADDSCPLTRVLAALVPSRSPRNSGDGAKTQHAAQAQAERPGLLRRTGSGALWGAAAAPASPCPTRDSDAGGAALEEDASQAAADSLALDPDQGPDSCVCVRDVVVMVERLVTRPGLTLQLADEAQQCSVASLARTLAALSSGGGGA